MSIIIYTFYYDDDCNIIGMEPIIIIIIGHVYISICICMDTANCTPACIYTYICLYSANEEL